MSHSADIQSRPEVGIVIPVHNRPSILIDTLSYVMAQTYQPARLVIVDDGSTDDTADRVENWFKDHSPDFEYMLVRKQKSSASDSRKQGFEKVSSFPYVAFLDSDDHWPPDFLERCVKSLEDNSDAVAATVDREFVSSIGQNTEDKGGESLVANPIAWIFEHGAGIASSSLLRTDAYVAAGGWPTDRLSSEDVELFSSISLQGPWVYSAGEPVRLHIGNSKLTGEAHNLSRTCAHASVQWAHDFEAIYKLLEEKAPDRDFRSLRPLMARRWALAARIAQKDEAHSIARDYYWKALKLNVFSMKHFRRWLECSIRTLSGSKKREIK